MFDRVLAIFFNPIYMGNFNKVMLHGNLTSDPEVIPTKTGKPLTTFSVAVDRDWKTSGGEKISETSFHKIVAFGKLGEIAGTYLKKGRPVLVCGRLNNRSYITKEGSKRYVTEIVMEDFNFLSRGKKSAKPKEEIKEVESEETGELVEA